MTPRDIAASPRVLVVINSPSSGPRRLADWLSGAGIEIVPALGSDGLPETLDGFDGLVLLGGGLMPDDYEQAPWLRAERDLVVQAIAQDLPTLGICLGAQVIADVAGGEVRASYGPKERGSTVIRPSDAGRRDPLLSALGTGAPMIENHEDMITRLPESATLLGSSDAVRNQAFVIGAHVRGVQFHPEAAAADLERWDDAALRGEGRDLGELIAAAESVHAENTEASRRLVAAFADEVRARARDASVGEALDGALGDADTRLAPAILIAAFDRAGVISWRALGEPRLDGAPTGRGTVFRIASMSKSFLAATALALAEEGRLDLGASIADYVPGARFTIRGPDGRDAEHRVTVAELLANRSGMPEDNAWGDRRIGASREEIAELARSGFALTALPGEKYQYSNLGMSLVGRAVEAVTGRSVEEQVRTRFIEPLGLSRTRYTADEFAAGSDLAHGFRTFDGGQSFTHEPYVGSGALACIGSLFSTVDDIAAWAGFLASGFADAPVRPELLSARSRREMQRAHTAIPIDEPGPYRELDALGYGFGMVAEHDRRFGRISQHSGGLPGFSSHMRWHARTGIGVVAFADSDAFRTELLAQDALARILSTAGASDAAATWPATFAAAERIDDALRTGASLAALDDVIATNLLLDVPEDVRRSRLAELSETAGSPAAPTPLAGRILSSQDPAHLRWRIACERGSLTCEIRLVGLEPPLVQSLEVSLGSGSATVLDGTSAAGEEGVQQQ